MLETAILCLALNIYHEGRSETLEGMNAIANVTLKRANRKPENICNVVFQPRQFSWANNLPRTDEPLILTAIKEMRPNEKKAWHLSKHIARKALVDKTTLPAANTATHYYNFKIVKPSWAYKMTVVAVIGNHIFLTAPTKT